MPPKGECESPYQPCPSLPTTQGVETEEEEDLVITLEGISTSLLAQLTGRFYRWLGKKLPLGADVRAIQVGFYRSVIPKYDVRAIQVGFIVLLSRKYDVRAIQVRCGEGLSITTLDVSADF